MSSTSSGSWSDESYCSGYSLVPVDSGNSSGSLSSGTPTSINSLRVENCTDFHVGPKIINNNHNQILNEDANWVTKLADKLIEPSKTGKWRSYRRLVVCLLIVLIALLISLTTVEVMRMRLEQDKTGPKPEVSTTAQPTTSPAGHNTEPSPSSTTTPATTTTTATTTKTITTANPEPDVVNKETWGGLDPPAKSKGTAYQARFIYFDNIYKGNCSGSERLKCIEGEFNKEYNKTEALEFNFLIDENGTIFEVRGWHYKAEDSDIFREAYKFGFIGEKANDKHVDSLRYFISQSSTYISYSYELIPVCCRDVDMDDERGPDSSFICHIYQSMLQDNLHQCYLDVKNCDTRSWIWRRMPTDICGNWDFHPYS